MFTIIISTAGARIVTLAFDIAFIGAGSQLCLLLGIPSFYTSVFNGLIFLVLDELGKSKLEISNKSVSDKTMVGLNLVFGELEDLIICLNLVLNQSFLFKVIPNMGYT